MTKVRMVIELDLATDGINVTGYPSNRTMALGMLERARHAIEKQWAQEEKRVVPATRLPDHPNGHGPSRGALGPASPSGG